MREGPDAIENEVARRVAVRGGAASAASLSITDLNFYVSGDGVTVSGPGATVSLPDGSYSSTSVCTNLLPTACTAAWSGVSVTTEGSSFFEFQGKISCPSGACQGCTSFMVSPAAVSVPARS